MGVGCFSIGWHHSLPICCGVPEPEPDHASLRRLNSAFPRTSVVDSLHLFCCWSSVMEDCVMDVSRRTFVKTGLAGAVGLSVFGFDLTPLHAQAQALKISRTTETRSTCPYCAVSCGGIIHTIGDKAKNV